MPAELPDAFDRRLAASDARMRAAEETGDDAAVAMELRTLSAIFADARGWVTSEVLSRALQHAHRHYLTQSRAYRAEHGLDR